MLYQEWSEVLPSLVASLPAVYQAALKVSADNDEPTLRHVKAVGFKTLNEYKVFLSCARDHCREYLADLAVFELDDLELPPATEKVKNGHINTLVEHEEMQSDPGRVIFKNHDLPAPVPVLRRGRKPKK